MKKIILLTTVLIISACNSQTKKKEEDNYNSKNKNMEYFDIEKYKDWEIDNDYETTDGDKFLKKGNERIQILDFDDKIKIEKSNILSPYSQFLFYNKSNKRLTLKGQMFYDADLGDWKYYDNSGHLEKIENFDSPYKLSIEDIIQLMKKEYDIDLLDVSDRKTVGRSVIDVPPVYYITIPIKQSRSHREITINANDGKLISDKIVNPDAKFLKNKK
jgi:hypothetical protein